MRHRSCFARPVPPPALQFRLFWLFVAVCFVASGTLPLFAIALRVVLVAAASIGLELIATGMWRNAQRRRLARDRPVTMRRFWYQAKSCGCAEATVPFWLVLGYIVIWELLEMVLMMAPYSYWAQCFTVTGEWGFSLMNLLDLLCLTMMAYLAAHLLVGVLPATRVAWRQRVPLLCALVLLTSHLHALLER
jgi:hypothetical protein